MLPLPLPLVLGAILAALAAATAGSPGPYPREVQDVPRPGGREDLRNCAVAAHDPFNEAWGGPAGVPALLTASVTADFLHFNSPGAGFREPFLMSVVDPAAAFQEGKEHVARGLLGAPGAAEAALLLHSLLALQTLHRERGGDAGPPGLVDVGADMGFATLAAARAGFPAVAFEPLAPHRAALQRSTCLNPGLGSLVTLVPAALGAGDGWCAAVPSGEAPAAVALECPGGGGAGALGRARAATLDGLVSRGLALPRAAVMRVSAPGMEVGVLEGARGWLSSGDAAPAMVHVWASAASAAAVGREMGARGYLLVTRVGNARGGWELAAWTVPGDFAVDAAAAVEGALRDAAGEPWAAGPGAAAEAARRARGVLAFVRPGLARSLGLAVREAAGPVLLPRGGMAGDDWRALGWEVAPGDWSALFHEPPAYPGPGGAPDVNPAVLPPRCRAGGADGDGHGDGDGDGDGDRECAVRRQNVAEMMGLAGAT